MKGLGDFLSDTGLLSHKDLDNARRMADERGEPLEEMLVRTGLVGEDDMRRAMAHTLGVPFVRLGRNEVSEEALVLLPEAISRAHRAVAYAKTPRGIEVAFLNTEDIKTVQEFLAPTYKLLPRLTDTESMTLALLQYQKLVKTMFGTVLSEELRRMQAAFAQGEAAHSPSVADASVRAVDALLRHALNANAREVELEPRDGLAVRYRIGRHWYDVMTLPLAVHVPLSHRFKTLAALPQVGAAPSTGRFSFFEIPGSSSDRVSVAVYATPIVRGTESTEKISFTFAREHEQGGFSLSSLAVSARHRQELRRALSNEGGLVLVCGQEGGGKTTMLYTLLDEVASSHARAATVEEAVGVALPGVSHMEIHDELGMTAVSCLRAQLRHGADTIMIDCPLDEELLNVAVRAANRGVRVLLGVDARTAAEGIEVVRSLGIPPELLAATLMVSVGVMQVPKLCPHGQEVGRLSRDEQRYLEERLALKEMLVELKDEKLIGQHSAWKDMQFRVPVPCQQCDQGYAGTVGLQEIIVPSRMIKDYIREGASADELSALARSEGALSFAEDALYKAAQGLVGASEVLAVAGE